VVAVEVCGLTRIQESVGQSSDEYLLVGIGIVVGIVGDIEKRASDFCAITSSNMGNFFFQSFRKSQQLKKVRFEPGSALPEPRTGLVVRFCTTIEPWTELWSGSEKFRFELWFRTGLRHPYAL
jgi:hypothetical protein